MFDTLHRMSLTKFYIQMEIYDAEFIRTPSYDFLLITQPIKESLEDTWRRLNTDPSYDPH